MPEIKNMSESQASARVRSKAVDNQKIRRSHLEKVTRVVGWRRYRRSSARMDTSGARRGRKGRTGRNGLEVIDARNEFLIVGRWLMVASCTVMDRVLSVCLHVGAG